MKVCIQAGHKGVTTGATGAYLAGVMDCDGWFAIKVGKGKKSPRFEIRVGVSNTNKKLIDLLKSKYNGCVSKRQKQENWKPEYIWALGNKKAAVFIADIYDFLVLKKDRADLCLKLQESLDEKRADYFSLPEELINYRFGLHEKLKKLNERGINI